jgi:hypothetical protein
MSGNVAAYEDIHPGFPDYFRIADNPEVDFPIADNTSTML